MKILIGFAIVMTTACATKASDQPGPRENMDVVDLTKAMNAEGGKKVAAGETITAEAAFDWRHFFKGAPSSKERPALQQNIRQLQSAASVEDLIKRGRNEFALGLYAASESSFRQTLRRDGKNIDALIELAASLQKQRRMAAALDTLAEAKNNLNAIERPDQALVFRYRYTLAMTYLANDDRTKAHTILTDLIGKDKTFLPGYAALAFSYLKDGKDSVARFIVDQALDRGGDHASLYNILGILAERQGNTAVAKDHYNHALTLSDTYAAALVNRGNLYMAAHEASMAETDYKRALDADPANADAMIGLGVVQRQTGRYASARDTFERVIEIEADNPQARFNLANLMRENLKDDGQALRYFNEVTQSERANQSLKSLAKAAIEEIRSL